MTLILAAIGVYIVVAAVAILLLCRVAKRRDPVHPVHVVAVYRLDGTEVPTGGQR